jgi:hypothetical protein
MAEEIDDTCILSKVDDTNFGECHANHTICMYAELGSTFYDWFFRIRKSDVHELF